MTIDDLYKKCPYSRKTFDFVCNELNDNINAIDHLFAYCMFYGEHPINVIDKSKKLFKNDS